MAGNKHIFEDLNYLSSELSKNLRSINFAVLAFIWGLLFTDIQSIANLIDRFMVLLLGIALVIILSLIFDFLQYVFGYLNTMKYKNKIDASDDGIQIKFNKKDKLYQLRTFSFYSKQVFTGIGVVGLFITLIMILTNIK